MSKLKCSVIVPIGPHERNTVQCVQQFMDLIGRCGEAFELIVVKAAASRQAFPDGVHLVSARLGRAQQLNAGAKAARGDCLWFVHADSKLRKEHVDSVAQLLRTQESRKKARWLGFFPLEFHDGTKWTRVNAVLANLRARYLGIAFGDQGLFMPKSLFFELGGFPTQFVSGEDHAFIQQTRFRGVEKVPSKLSLPTSARKYLLNGYLQTTGLHVTLTLLQEFHYWKRKLLVRNP